MWTCPACNRILQKSHQAHSCRKVPVESHFANRETAKALFDTLLNRIEETVGACTVISLPCCIHLFGTYEFLAVLPKKDGIELRFALRRVLNTPKLKASVSISKNEFKNCLIVHTTQEIDDELLGWLKESFHLKETMRMR